MCLYNCNIEVEEKKVKKEKTDLTYEERLKIEDMLRSRKKYNGHGDVFNVQKRKRGIQMNKLNEKNAITLIALIMTIVILLVLTGVAINLSMGENGIISKAQGAVDIYRNAQEKEEYEIAKIKNEIEYYTRAGGLYLTEEELNEKINTAIETAIRNERSKYKIGQLSIPSIAKYSSSDITVTFDTPLTNNNYNVAFALTGNGAYWSWLSLRVVSKSTTGFTINVYNNGDGTSAVLSADWIMISNN